MFRRQATMVITERANMKGLNGNNIIAIIGKQKQIRLMFHFKFTWIGKLLKIYLEKKKLTVSKFKWLKKMFHHFCQLLSYNLAYTDATQAAIVFKAIQDMSITFGTCSQNLSAR